MVGKLESIADTLYSIHADLLSMGIIGKDCERFANVLARIGRVQQELRIVAEEAKREEAQDVGDS